MKLKRWSLNRRLYVKKRPKPHNVGRFLLYLEVTKWPPFYFRRRNIIMRSCFFDLPAPYIILSVTVAILTYLGRSPVPTGQRVRGSLAWPLLFILLGLSSFITVGGCLVFLLRSDLVRDTASCLVPITHITFIGSIFCVILMVILQIRKDLK